MQPYARNPLAAARLQQRSGRLSAAHFCGAELRRPGHSTLAVALELGVPLRAWPGRVRLRAVRGSRELRARAREV